MSDASNIQKCIKHLASYFFIFGFEHALHALWKNSAFASCTVTSPSAQ